MSRCRPAARANANAEFGNWEHTIRDDEDFARHVDYIHFNAVKHGYVERPQDWPYSSFHRLVRAGTYPREWSRRADDPDGGFGER